MSVSGQTAPPLWCDGCGAKPAEPGDLFCARCRRDAERKYGLPPLTLERGVVGRAIALLAGAVAAGQCTCAQLVAELHRCALPARGWEPSTDEELWDVLGGSDAPRAATRARAAAPPTPFGRHAVGAATPAVATRPRLTQLAEERAHPGRPGLLDVARDAAASRPTTSLLDLARGASR